ncbi:hypothetical protein HK096_001981, partial [Nowakowskiella sp. JEL0078]
MDSNSVEAGSQTSWADFLCESETQYAEWLDGFYFLLDKTVKTKHAGDFIKDLTDIRLKISLLDLTGDGIEIPSTDLMIEDTMSPSETPQDDFQFWYDEETASLDEADMEGFEQEPLEMNSNDEDSETENSENIYFFPQTIFAGFEDG